MHGTITNESHLEKLTQVRRGDLLHVGLEGFPLCTLPNSRTRARGRGHLGFEWIVFCADSTAIRILDYAHLTSGWLPCPP
jgi:hypothetical protein